MTIEKINKYLKETLGGWNSTDLFYALCSAKGIEDPEVDLTEEEYTALEKELCERVTYTFLSNLVSACCQDVNDRIYAAF